MSRMKLRTFAAGLLLISASIGLTLEFADGFLSHTGQDISKESEIRQIRSDFGERKNNITDTGESETTNIGVQTDFFFLSSVWNVITSVATGVGDILGIVQRAGDVTGLNIPDPVYNLVGLVVIGVIFAVVSAARGWDV